MKMNAEEEDIRLEPKPNQPRKKAITPRQQTINIASGWVRKMGIKAKSKFFVWSGSQGVYSIVLNPRFVLHSYGILFFCFHLIPWSRSVTMQKGIHLPDSYSIQLQVPSSFKSSHTQAFLVPGVLELVFVF